MTIQFVGSFSNRSINVEDLGVTESEWSALDDDDKYALAWEYAASNCLDWGFEEQ